MITGDGVRDVLDIQDLIARVAQAVDEGDLEMYEACFTESARWVTEASSVLGMLGTELVGRDAIVAGAKQRQVDGIQGPGSNTRHIVSTVTVVLDGPDRARARVYWQYVINTTSAPVLKAVGAYDNVLEREEGGWKIAERILRQG